MRGFGLGGRVMSRLGATTVLVPGGKLGEAFDKHEIDAAEFLTPAVDQRQRLQDHAKLIYVPGWHQPETVLELLINQDKWNALNDEQQTVIETACRAMLLTTLAESPRLQARALAELAKRASASRPGRTIWCEPFAAPGRKLRTKRAIGTPFFQDGADDIEKFRAKAPSRAQPTLPPMPPAREGGNATRGPLGPRVAHAVNSGLLAGSSNRR